MSTDFKAGKAPFRWYASYIRGYDGLLVDKDPTEELTFYCESFSNVKKENVTEASAVVDFWQHSWTV